MDERTFGRNRRFYGTRWHRWALRLVWVALGAWLAWSLAGGYFGWY